METLLMCLAFFFYGTFDSSEVFGGQPTTPNNIIVGDVSGL